MLDIYLVYSIKVYILIKSIYIKTRTLKVCTFLMLINK